MRIIIGTVGTLYLAFMLLTSLPVFQSRAAAFASELLARKVGSRVTIGNLRLSILGRVILDNVELYDRQDTLMLKASRIAAKVDLLPLMNKHIRINNAQLIGAHARLYRNGAEPLNCQFLIDAFSSKDTTSTPLDLGIGVLVVRRGEVCYDRTDKDCQPGRLDPNHLHIRDLNLTARVLAQMPDTLSFSLKGLSLREQSGLTLDRLSLSVEAGQHAARLHELCLQMPGSVLNIPELTMSYDGLAGAFTKAWLERCQAHTALSGSISPCDLKCLVPKLATFTDGIRLSSELDLKDGDLRIDGCEIADQQASIRLLCDATLKNLLHQPTVQAEIHSLQTTPALQQFLTQNLQGEAREVSPILTRLGNTMTSGTLSYHSKDLKADIETKTTHGMLSVKADLQDMHELTAKLSATNIQLGELLDMKGTDRQTAMTLDANVGGTLPRQGQPARLTADALVHSLLYRNYEHRNLRLAAAMKGDEVSGEFSSEEPNGQIWLQAQTALAGRERSLQYSAEVRNFAPHSMNLTTGYEGQRFSGRLEGDFSNISLDALQGSLTLSDLALASEGEATLHPGDIRLSSDQDEDGQHVLMESPFLCIKADGIIDWKSLPHSFIQPARHNLPNLFKVKEQKMASTNDFRFFVQVQDTLLAERLLGSTLQLPARSTLEGRVNDAVGQIALQVNVPELLTGNQHLLNIDCRAEGSTSAIQASLQCERLMKGKPVELNVDAYARDNKVTTRLRWDNKRSVKHNGDISLSGIIRRDLSDRLAVDAKVNASRIVIGDSLWRMEPATVRYHDEVIDIENLKVSQAERHLAIGGRISAEPTDTLRAQLASIDISYIMDLVNFHSVDFDGEASGTVIATSLMKQPYADAYLQVKDFSFNQADLGLMDLSANWGKRERAILLEADMRGSAADHHTHLTGSIVPVKGEDNGLDLNIRTNHIDLSFMNRFTSGIFRDFQGRASGWARVFGPFKKINLEGDLFINELQTHVLAIGTDYHMVGDSVILRPDNIWMTGAHIYDDKGHPGKEDHSGIVNLHLMHQNFKNLRFNITAATHNILGYNFPTQGNMNFYGKAYADAIVRLKGEPGSVNIDVTAKPTAGTTLNYNVATPGTVTETGFITYVSAKDSTQAALGRGETEDIQMSSDLRINFDIDVNPDARLNLLMDARSGDNITLFGSGRMRASYYNKGRFQLFGTYHVDHGSYRMSIRDLIRKDFEFKPDGTIVFGGDAMQAALNLKATYTVPNVSLDDLSATSLGLSNTRVDCIMNIGGRAKEPVVTFDFDIPNANEDEKQMVRSMISSEEERDMQAIYLLGVGRFYSNNLQMDKRQSQGGLAVNSMLSSVISSRFNQIMSQALGGSNWSFGTNLRTGQTGWEELDVEGLLSGRMLSGRLLFNGNFGYRDNKYRANQNNFIGDFDIQYRLSPRSPFSLKAYNKTNDRYFTQSALTTQGIGLQFERDFNHWKEMFRRARKSKK